MKGFTGQRWKSQGKHFKRGRGESKEGGRDNFFGHLAFLGTKCQSSNVQFTIEMTNWVQENDPFLGWAGDRINQLWKTD